MQSLVNDIELGGGVIVYKTPFQQTEVKPYGFEIRLGGTEPAVVQAKYLINSTRLNAVNVAKSVQGLSGNHIPKPCFAKGNYHGYLGKVPFQRLIYPTTESGGLGIHLTLDISGQVKLGPDVEWIENIDYRVIEQLKFKFAQAMQSYWPSCDISKLVPAYCGVIAKLGSHEYFHDDFLIQTKTDHGVKGLVNLFGIDSPGLTASLAIAEDIVNLEL